MFTANGESDSPDLIYALKDSSLVVGRGADRGGLKKSVHVSTNCPQKAGERIGWSLVRIFLLHKKSIKEEERGEITFAAEWGKEEGKKEGTRNGMEEGGRRGEGKK